MKADRKVIQDQIAQEADATGPTPEGLIDVLQIVDQEPQIVNKILETAGCPQLRITEIRAWTNFASLVLISLAKVTRKTPAELNTRIRFNLQSFVTMIRFYPLLHRDNKTSTKCRWVAECLGLDKFPLRIEIAGEPVFSM